jgi:two-component system CheB/CheR fusion protein
MRILFVDDNFDLRNMMKLLLERRGYVVRTAATGPEALDCAPAFAPHIVLSDISMPEMDGYDFIAQLRAQTTQRFGGVALTGFCAPSDIARARAAGFDECLSKPINFEQLFNTLEKLKVTLALDEANYQVLPENCSSNSVSKL